MQSLNFIVEATQDLASILVRKQHSLRQRRARNKIDELTEKRLQKYSENNQDLNPEEQLEMALQNEYMVIHHNHQLAKEFKHDRDKFQEFMEFQQNLGQINDDTVEQLKQRQNQKAGELV